MNTSLMVSEGAWFSTNLRSSAQPDASGVMDCDDVTCTFDAPATTTQPVAVGVPRQQPWYPAVVAMFSIMGIAALPGNVLTVVTYVRTPALRKLPDHLVFALALWDALSCLMTQPLQLIMYTAWGQQLRAVHINACLYALLAGGVTIFTALTNVMILTLERFVSLVKPVFHRTWSSKCSIKVMVTLSPVVSASLLTIGRLSSQDGGRQPQCKDIQASSSASPFHLLMLALVMVIITINILIARIAHRHLTKVSPGSTMGVPGRLEAAVGLSAQEKQAHMNCRIIKMQMAVSFNFCVPTLPVFALRVVFTALHILHIQPPNALLALSDFGRTLFLVGPLLNPLIYAWQHPGFSMAFTKLLRTEAQLHT